MTACTQCQVETPNEKFCSRSCSITFNNQLSPKRKAQLQSCPKCKTMFPKYHGRKHCPSCVQKLVKSRRLKIEEIQTLTLAEIQQRFDKKKIKGLNRNAVVRYYCRKTNKELFKNNKLCRVCGYNKHVEACHITAISSFSDDSRLSEVNDPKNIIFLCPNHHWELDNGLLKV